jgi:ABC-type transport system involved in cytochrome bd biosynthesis fused ATPase/permease subunit
LFLKYLELILTVAGVVVVVIFFSVFRGIAPWKAAALSAVAVGVLHGAIFFAVRSAQRHTRNKELRLIRQTLNDLMRNKLQAVMFAAEIKNQDWRPEAQQAVLEIQNRLNAIEGEALRFKRGE